MLKSHKFIICYLLLATTLFWSNLLYPTVGLMGALDEEINLLKENMEIKVIDTLANRFFYKGTLEKRDVVITKSGIGKVNTAMTAQILIDKYDIKVLIFTGVAGGINPALKIGDIVISSQVAQHDFGEITPEGFFPFSIHFFKADSCLIRVAQKAAQECQLLPIPTEVTHTPTRKPQIVTGALVTGDQFIASEAKRNWLEKTFNADAVEMEGSAVAQVCEANKVPFVIIRCLSDIANENASIEFEKFCPYAARNSVVIVKQMLQILDNL